MLTAPRRVSACPVRPDREGSTQSNMSTPAQHAADDVVRLADAHQVARPVRRQLAGAIVEHPEHRRLPLADREPADGVAVEADLLQRRRPLLAQLARDAALHDAEERMPRPVAERRPASAAPSASKAAWTPPPPPRSPAAPGTRRRHITMSEPSSRWISMLRSGDEMVHRPVDVAAEGHPLLGELAEVGQAHHLEAARVGQDRPLPVHQAVQPPEPRHPLGPGPQHQVIGIAEQDVGARRRARSRAASP